MSLKRVAIAAALLAGCHHAAPPAKPAPAPAVACSDVTRHVHDLLAPKHPDPELDRMTLAVQTRCTDDAWGADARTCIVETHALGDGHHCLDRLAPAQRIAFEAALHAAIAIPPPVSTSRLPASCQRYRTQMESYIACDKIPQAARDAMAQGFESQWSTYEQMSDADLPSLDAACAAAVSALASLTCPP